MIPIFWVVVGLTALSGFFSLTGFALRSVRRGSLEQAFVGPNSQRRARYIEQHADSLRLTASVGRVLSNVFLVVSMIYLMDATATVARLISAILAATTVIGIFGVAIPSAWAKHAGQKVLAGTFGAMMLFRYAFYPVTAIMGTFDVPIRRLSGIADTDDENGEAAKQEILQAISEGQADGTVEPEEGQMIESVMEFGETQAAEIMTPRTDMFSLPINTPWGEAVQKVVEAGHTRVPVYEENMDRIVGVLYAKDMLKYGPNDTPDDIRTILRKCYFVPETKPLDKLLKEFKARKVHLAIVLDEYGGTAGLVSIEDVVEEIVGDISDEYDQATPASMKRLDDCTIEMDGRFYVDELNDAMGLDLPENEDYDTVAGFVFSELGYIPKIGEALDSHSAKFTVVAADERKITRLRVKLLPPEVNEQ